MNGNNESNYGYAQGVVYEGYPVRYKALVYNEIPAISVTRVWCDAEVLEDAEVEGYERIEMHSDGVIMYKEFDGNDIVYLKQIEGVETQMTKQEFNNDIELIEESMESGYINGRLQIENILDKRAILMEVDRMAPENSVPQNIKNLISSYVMNDNSRNVVAEKKIMAKLLENNREDARKERY